MPFDLPLVLGLPCHLFELLTQRLALTLAAPNGDGAIAHRLRVAIEEGEGGEWRALGPAKLPGQRDRRARGARAAWSAHALQRRCRVDRRPHTRGKVSGSGAWQKGAAVRAQRHDIV